MKTSHQHLNPLLKVAIKVGVLDAVRVQIERGCPIDSVDSTGLTPLMLAAIFKKPEIFKFLLNLDASLNQVDSKGKSAIDYAKLSGMQQIMDLIFEYKKNNQDVSWVDSDEDNEKIRERYPRIVTLGDHNIESNTVVKMKESSDLVNQIDHQFIEMDINLGFELESEGVSYFNSDSISNGLDSWLNDDTSIIPKNDLDCVLEAEKIYKNLVNHTIIEMDESSWSDVKIDLPVIHTRAINVKEKFSNLYDLALEAISRGRVNYDQVLIATSADIGEPHKDIILPIILNIFGDLGVLVEEFDFFDMPSNNNENNHLFEEMITDSLTNLHYELEGDLTSLNVYFSEIQKFELIDRMQEEKIGQEMNIALFLLAKNIANLSNEDWVTVTEVFDNNEEDANNPNVIEEKELMEDAHSIEETEIVDEEWDISKDREDINFWDHIVLIRQNSKLCDSNQHIPRPTSKNLKKLLEITKKFNEPTAKQFTNLINKYKRAQEKLLNANFRLVSHYAKKYVETGMPLEDLIQEGNIGLLTAIDKFDYHLGYKFSTYATWWIKQAITRAIANSNRLIRLPVHAHELVNTIENARKYLEEKGTPITLSSIARQAECSEKDVIKARNANIRVEFFDDVSYEDIEYLNENEFICPSLSLEGLVSEIELREAIYEQLSELDERQAKTIELRFGLVGDKDMTLEEIGSLFNVTRERIRQIESKVLDKLRHQSRAQYLKPFYD